MRAGWQIDVPPPLEVFCCTKCNLRWLNPMPTRAEYEEIYDRGYLAPREASLEVSWLNEALPQPQADYATETVPARLATYEGRLERLERLLGAKGTLLDIGAGTGDFLAIAVRRGWEAVGIEKGQYACDYARENHGVEVLCRDLYEFESAERFDVVHLSHVLEHVVAPHEFLERVMPMIKDGGILAIEVPNQFDSWVQRTLHRAGKGKAARSLYSVHHPYFYSYASISTLFRQHDLDIVRARTFFPERWTTKPLHGSRLAWSALRIIDITGDRIGKHGENIEVFAAKAGRQWA
jgi:SAM-dependent methyltransferase